jgi:segregation and condensation protein B
MSSSTNQAVTVTHQNGQVDKPSQLQLDGDIGRAGYSTIELASLIEALLLVAPEPPGIDELAESVGVTAEQIQAALDELASQADSRGWIVQKHGNRLHLASAPRFAAQISSFLGLEREGKLSAAALETLAIVAYQQPVTRAEIEAVRGVDCSGVIATLHARELVEPVSRLNVVGNPFQYGTTIGFLKLFGLSSLADLPPIGELEGQDGLTLLGLAAAQGGETEDESPDDSDSVEVDTGDRELES